MAILTNCSYCGKSMYSEHNLCDECRKDPQGNLPYEEWESLGSKIADLHKNHNGLGD